MRSPISGLSIRISFQEFDLPIGFSSLAINAENLAKGPKKINSIILDGWDASRTGERGFSLRGTFETPLFLSGFEVETQQHVPFLFDPIAQKDFITRDSCSSKSAFKIRGPENLRA